MKSPPVQHPDAVALELTEAFIRGEGGAVAIPPAAPVGTEAGRAG
jgi:hypothetical protein